MPVDLKQFADRGLCPTEAGQGVDDELGPRESRMRSPNGGPGRHLPLSEILASRR